MASMTPKQQLFIDEYLKCFDGTEAARRAKYKGDDNTLSSVGYENLRKPEIAEQIKRRLQESAMSADEVLMRLGDMARGNIGEFAGIDSSYDLANHPKSQLVKKFKKKIYHTRSGDDVEELDIELYDAHAALVDIGRKHAMFSDNINLKLEKEIEQLLDKLSTKLDSDTYQKVLEAIIDSD